MGVRYRASSKPTDGVADREERFVPHKDGVLPDELHFARLRD